MANRHLSRSVVLQTLFASDFDSERHVDAKAILPKIIKEFVPEAGGIGFMEKLLAGVLEKRPELDQIIEKAAPEWPIDKIAPIDRNVLRMGLYELLFSDRKEVPAKVAINEAIELGKRFGGEASGKFVNGVLGAVYKELGEPGKDEVPKRAAPIPVDRLLGAVIYARDGSDVYIALVHDVFGHWTLSKGHLKDGESEKTGLNRIALEEVGIPVTIKENIGNNEYLASHPEQGKIRKRVDYFLAEASFRELTLGKKGGLDDARWFKLAEIRNLNFYNDMLPVVTKAVNILVKK